MIFRYPGGKTKLLPIILDKINPQERFMDVFVGGGSVLCAVAKKYPDIQLYANDLDETISSFWHMTQADDDTVNEFFKLIDQTPTLDLFYFLRSTRPRNLIEKAYYAVFFNRCTFSGISTSGPLGGKNQDKYNICSRYNAKTIKSNFLKLRELLRHRLTVTNLDFPQYLKLFDGTMYLDPPYYSKGRVLYPKYMTPKEHVLLSKLLRTKSDWILSYDDCVEINELYTWASVEKINATYCINGTKANWKGKQELLISP